MSLYNSLFGVNNIAPLLLKILGIDQPTENAPEWPKNSMGDDWDPHDDGVTDEAIVYINKCKEQRYYTSGRFRDIYLNEDKTRIVLYTRNGGGNRESYPHIFAILRSHPNYIQDFDDDFDCTYAYYEFSIPDEFKDDLKMMPGESKSPSEKMQKIIEDLQVNPSAG